MTDPFANYAGIAVEVDGKVTMYPLTGLPRRVTIRFAFGVPGRRSGVWNVITQRNGDVYVNEQTNAADIKVSLHKKNWWQLSFVDNNGVMSPLGQSWMETHESRHLHRRQRPATSESVVLGIRVLVTWHDVQDWPDEDETEDSVTWLEPPDEGEMGYVLVAFHKPHAEVTPLGRLGVLGIYPIQTGEAVVTTFSYEKLGPEEIVAMNMMRAGFIDATTSEQLATYPPGFAPRSVFYITSNPDELGAWDAAMIEAAAPPE